MKIVVPIALSLLATLIAVTVTVLVTRHRLGLVPDEAPELPEAPEIAFA